MMISYQELVRTFLSRLFRQETGKSPAKAIEGLRLE
ncbi:GlxA family transcriptional regulator, partial [Klebsiella pneumoniae]